MIILPNFKVYDQKMDEVLSLNPFFSYPVLFIKRPGKCKITELLQRVIYIDFMETKWVEGVEKLCYEEIIDIPMEEILYVVKRTEMFRSINPTDIRYNNDYAKQYQIYIMNNWM